MSSWSVFRNGTVFLQQLQRFVLAVRRGYSRGAPLESGSHQVQPDCHLSTRDVQRREGRHDMSDLSSRLMFFSCTWSFISEFAFLVWIHFFFHATGHYCVGGVALPCPAGTYGAPEGLQKLRDCTVCPAGRLLAGAQIVYVSILYVFNMFWNVNF